MGEKKNLKTVEVNGVKFEISPDVFDDFEIIDAFDEIQQGNALRIAGAMRLIVGDRYRDLMNVLRDEDTGRVSTERVGEVFTQIIQEIAPN